MGPTPAGKAGAGAPGLAPLSLPGLLPTQLHY